jgi:RNase P subunit RPR2
MAIRDKRLERDIAEERIRILFSFAEQDAGKTDGLSKRYIRLIKKLSSHYKVTIPKKLKATMCKKCNDIIVPGVNGKVRLASSTRRVLCICDKCGTENGLPY